MDVFDQHGARGCSIALPQLAAVCRVLGRKEQRPIQIRKAVGKRSARAGVNVSDHLRAGRRAIGLPELEAVSGIHSGKEHHPVYFREFTRVAVFGSFEDTDQRCAFACSVALP